MLSADNICKQFGSRSGLIRIQTISHSDPIPERILENVNFEKSADENITQHAKS